MLPCGSTFLDGNDEEQDYHLHIIASNVDPSGDVVVVSVSTMYRFADKTTILKVGDHPWLRHESYVAYSFAKLQKTAAIEARLVRLPKMMKQPCTEVLVKRIQDGLLDSEQTEHGVKNFFRELHLNRR